MTNEQMAAIARIGEIAQDKNANWLGYSNIKAMHILLDLIREQQVNEAKQNKIIDDMAELIARKTGARIEICHNMNCDKTIEKECKKCAKEYFEQLLYKSFSLPAEALKSYTSESAEQIKASYADKLYDTRILGIFNK
ncbi:MAG: hypothetical protein IJE05_01840 [Clostridia bacterium]|nr:hypothetical protein [Clostridia bacterium]